MAAESKKFGLGKVLVTGGCGFLGHHVVRLILRDYNAEIAVIDLRCNNNRQPESDGVRYFEADITDALRVVTVLEEVRPDVVIHTAAPAPQANTVVADGLYKKVNVDGTRTIIEACKKTGVKALVYTSSASIISDNVNDLVNADEKWPVIRGKAQSEYYSETKVGVQPSTILVSQDAKH
jgi:sterol-4alpha-carboxylate 3-dehydrogenase (decarboxylating)